MTDMHYTSWSPRRSGRSATLWVEDGSEKLGTFGVEKAEVDGDTWVLNTQGGTGLKATATDGREFTAAGTDKRAHTIAADLAGKKLTLINENSANWVVLTQEGAKVAQFSGANNGVRRSIVEFVADEDDPDRARKEIEDLSREEVAALSWFARSILEARLSRTTGMAIVTLVALSILAVLSFLL